MADAKQAIVEYDTHLAAYEKARPALEWFEAHCRFLSELEIAIRKLDDLNSFVCDPKAKKRPKGLTSELVLEFSTLPTLGVYQEHHGENHRCLEADRASRIGLVFVDDLTVRQKLELLCWDDSRPTCIKAREAMEAAQRAKAKQAGM